MSFPALSSMIAWDLDFEIPKKGHGFSSGETRQPHKKSQWSNKRKYFLKTCLRFFKMLGNYEVESRFFFKKGSILG